MSRFSTSGVCFDKDTVEITDQSHGNIKPQCTATRKKHLFSKYFRLERRGNMSRHTKRNPFELTKRDERVNIVDHVAVFNTSKALMNKGNGQGNAALAISG